MNKITMTRRFTHESGRNGYFLHTENAVYAAYPEGTSSYLISGWFYKTLKLAKAAIETGTIVNNPNRLAKEEEAFKARGTVEPPCNPVYLLAVMLGDCTQPTANSPSARKLTDMEREVLDCFGLIDPVTGKIDVAISESIVKGHERDFEAEKEAREE